MSQALINIVAKSSGWGTATGGSNTTLVDANSIFEADIFNNAILKMNIEGKNYYATITDTADSTLTFAALAGDAAPSAGTRYQILLGMGWKAAP
jgi:hypothetical protein